MMMMAGEAGTNHQARRPRPSRKRPKFVVFHGGQQLEGEAAEALLQDISGKLKQRAETRLQRIESRHHMTDRLSISRALLSVEQRLVEALWTLQCLPNDRGIGFAKRNGVGYADERVDLYANAVANGGWLTTAPRPAPPSAKAIDAMHEPLDWLRFLDREQARILTLGAQYKRGDVARNIGWARIRQRNPELKDMSARYLAKQYVSGLRSIVVELTLARAEQKR